MRITPSEGFSSFLRVSQRAVQELREWAQPGEVGTATMSPAEQPLLYELYVASSCLILLPVTSLGQPAELHQRTEGNWKAIPPVSHPCLLHIPFLHHR